MQTERLMRNAFLHIKVMSECWFFAFREYLKAEVIWIVTMVQNFDSSSFLAELTMDLIFFFKA